ncbi:MAG: histidine phosphatase family protein [Acidimicrobiia bacterium]|nr:histidine phosphatase family protein [Acidimicrobiia bacterium]
MAAAEGKRLVLVRHGETEWSRDGRHTGRTDVPLTRDGEKRARFLVQRLPRLGVEPLRVLSSPRQRAIDTARLAGYGMPEITHLLAELDYGEYEGRTSSDIRSERPGWDLFTDGAPGGESLADAAARCQRLLDDIDPDDGHGDVLLFAHGHILRVLGVTYLGLPPEQARCLALDPAAVSILGHEHWWRAVCLWNSTA